jgi:hypothetical protein
MPMRGLWVGLGRKFARQSEAVFNPKTSKAINGDCASKTAQPTFFQGNPEGSGWGVAGPSSFRVSPRAARQLVKACPL